MRKLFAILRRIFRRNKYYRTMTPEESELGRSKPVNMAGLFIPGNKLVGKPLTFKAKLPVDVLEVNTDGWRK